MLLGERGVFIIELVRRDYVERFAGSVLGSLWAFIWPLVNLFIYIVIFGKMMGARLPGTSDMNAYGVYLAAGLIPWNCFSATIGRSTSVFLDKKNIISKVNTSLPALLVFINLSEIVTYLISMLIFAVFLLFQDFTWRIELLLLPFIFYLQQIMAFTIGIFAATLTIFLRDTKELIGIILQLWFWFTPIVYLADILPDMAQRLLLLNPAFGLIDAYHRLFVFNQVPNLSKLIILTIIVHLLLILFYKMFRVLERDIRDFL